MNVVYVLMVKNSEEDDWGVLDRAGHPDVFGVRYPGLSEVYWDWKVYRETTQVVRELVMWRPAGGWDVFSPRV